MIRTANYIRIRPATTHSIQHLFLEIMPLALLTAVLARVGRRAHGCGCGAPLPSIIIIIPIHLCLRVLAAAQAADTVTSQHPDAAKR
jgi:hypothetical protein